MSFSSTNNYSLYAIPAAWVASIVPHFWAITRFDSLQKKGGKTWDNASEYIREKSTFVPPNSTIEAHGFSFSLALLQTPEGSCPLSAKGRTSLPLSSLSSERRPLSRTASRTWPFSVFPS